MRAAIIGCGNIAKTHVRAIQALKWVEICGACDRDIFQAKQIADMAGDANAYDDFEKMLEQEKPDVVHVLTPPDTHANLSIQAMDAGCHVFVEKPMAVHKKEAREMVAAAKRNNVSLCTDHNYLYKPSFTRVRELVNQGAIGDVVYIDAYYGHSLDDEGKAYITTGGRSHWAWKLLGGAFINFLPHLIYLVLEFMPDYEKVVGVTVAGEDRPGAPVMEMTALLQGKSATGNVSISMRANPYSKFIDLYGTKGIIHADIARELYTIHRYRKMPGMVSKVIFNLEEAVQLTVRTIANVINVFLGKLKGVAGLYNLVQEFYDNLKSGAPPPVTGEDGLEMVAMMETILGEVDREMQQRKAAAVKLEPDTPGTEVEKNIAASGGISGKVLVTGATGFLGSNLVAALSRCGADVVALARDKDSISPELERRAQIVYGDIRDEDSMVAAMRGIDIVYHCAAITTNKTKWLNHNEVNILGTQSVLNAAQKVGVRQAIHISSVVVYSLKSARSGRPYQETDALIEYPNRWAYYQRSKLGAEQIAQEFMKNSELPVTIIRPGILFGPETGAPANGLVRVGALRFFIGSGRNNLPYTYIDNATDCLLLAAVSSEAVGEIFNLVDQPQSSPRDVIQHLKAITGENIAIIPIPPILLNTMGLVFETMSNSSQDEKIPKISRFLVRSEYRNVSYDSSKAQNLIGWQTSVSLQEGLKKTAKK